MEKPSAPEPPPGDAQKPLSFSLNQAAALCGVSAHQVWEWTACGYVRSSGRGDHRRYDREALRQIAAMRDAVRSGHNPDSRAAQPSDGAPAHRCEEFSLPAAPIDDGHLMVQTELYFALNAGAGTSADSLAGFFGVEAEQMTRILDAMVQARHLARTRNGDEVLYGVARPHLQGPSIREQRVRATHRTRIPSQDA